MSQRASGGSGWTIGLYVIAFLLGIGYVVWLSSEAPRAEPPDTALATSPTETPTSTPTVENPTSTPRPTRTPRPTDTPEIPPTITPTPSPLRVGVVAGHWQSDSGAVCPDGTQEATVNLDVAARVVAILQNGGYNADLMAEFAPELRGYRADAFVSIHTDSCDTGLSGFKVARLAHSAIPEAEDQLVSCLIRQYGRETGLQLHADTITFDMTEYHAFSEIDPHTPAAIIELGFMDTDRTLLTEHSYDVAMGVATGIVCFLEGK